MDPAGVALVALGLSAGLVLLWKVPVPAIGPGPGGSVSVVVPARDEARALPRLLASLQVQTVPPAEVLVVDDGSTDRTAAIAAGHGAAVHAAPSPPSGWLGKPWACDVGARAARGERLVLLDADTWLAPDGLERLLSTHAERAPHGLLSVQPFHEVRRPHEQLSAVCNVVPVMAAGFAAARPKASCAVAFGPCLVTRATDLAAVGGFAAVAGEVVEDAALAAAYRRAGRAVACAGGGDAVRFRMYPDGLRSLVQGWTKNLAGGASRAGAVTLVGAVLWVSAGLSITVDALTAPGVAVAVAWAAYAGELWWALRRLGSFHPLTAVLFPLPLLAFVALFLRSAAVRASGRPVRWRGRAIDPRRGNIL
jgi:4,4'-diaponeurosporenoate glycosyltransferase